MGPAGPERFHRGFLRGEAARKPLGAVAMLFAVGNFRRRENALDKCAAVAPDGRFDAVNFGDVQAQANDHLPSALPAAGAMAELYRPRAVSYTHLTMTTNRQVNI